MSGDGPEIPDMTADVEEEVRPQDDSKIEVMRGETVTGKLGLIALQLP